jgi:capsular polysaccharide biosynthesis protein
MSHPMHRYHRISHNVESATSATEGRSDAFRSISDEKEPRVVTDDPVHRGDVPPVDLAGHFRELGRAFLPALLIAVVVGGAVFGLRTVLVAKEYAASIVTQITPSQTLIPGDAFIEQMRAPFMGLAHDANVLNQVLAESDTGWNADTLSQHVELTPGPSPQLLVFTATAGTPELAAQLARSMVVTVAQASFANHARDVGRQVEQIQASVAAEEARNATLGPEDPAKADSDKKLADLRVQLSNLQRADGDQLTILSTPEQGPDPVSPRPASEALVAGLAALIVAAELIVLLRSRLGSKPNRSWARRVANRYRARYDADVIDDGTLSPLAAASLAQHQRAGRRVLVLLGEHAVAPRPLVATEGRPAAHASDRTDAPRRTMRKGSISGEWWQNLYLGDVAAAAVLVSTSGSDRKAAERSLQQLANLGVPTHLVLQSGRKGRRETPPPLAPAAAAVESQPGRVDDRVG